MNMEKMEIHIKMDDFLLKDGIGPRGFFVRLLMINVHTKFSSSICI